MFWNKDGIVGVTNMKPAGTLYIDDRGYRYNNVYEFIRYMENNSK